MDEARKEKPRPRDTEPAAMGREVRRGTILLFRLAEEMAMAEERDTAVSEEVMAITMELMIADNPVPAPVGALEMMSFQAFKVKLPSLVKKAL